MKIVHLVVVLPYVLRAMSASADEPAVNVFDSQNDLISETTASTSASNGETDPAGFR